MAEPCIKFVPWHLSSEHCQLELEAASGAKVSKPEVDKGNEKEKKEQEEEEEEKRQEEY
jgi:hypothetical protein